MSDSEGDQSGSDSFEEQDIEGWPLEEKYERDTLKATVSKLIETIQGELDRTEAEQDRLLDQISTLTKALQKKTDELNEEQAAGNLAHESFIETLERFQSDYEKMEEGLTKELEAEKVAHLETKKYYYEEFEKMDAAASDAAVEEELRVVVRTAGGHVAALQLRGSEEARQVEQEQAGLAKRLIAEQERSLGLFQRLTDEQSKLAQQKAMTEQLIRRVRETVAGHTATLEQLDAARRDNELLRARLAKQEGADPTIGAGKLAAESGSSQTTLDRLAAHPRLQKTMTSLAQIERLHSLGQLSAQKLERKLSKAVAPQADRFVDRLEQGRRVRCLLAHDGHAWVGLADGSLRVYDRAGAHREFIAHYPNEVAALTTAAGCVWSAAKNGVKLWHPRTGQPLGEIRAQIEEGTRAKSPIICPAAGERVWIYNRDLSVRVYSGGKVARPERAFTVDALITAIASHATARLVWCATLSGLVAYGPGGGKAKRRVPLQLGERALQAAALLALPEHQLLVGSSEGTLALFSESGQCLRTADAHHGRLTALLPFGRSFLTAGQDNLVKMWDAQLRLVDRIGGHSQPVTSLALVETADQEQPLTLWSGSEDGYIGVWHLSGPPKEKKKKIGLAGLGGLGGLALPSFFHKSGKDEEKEKEKEPEVKEEKEEEKKGRDKSRDERTDDKKKHK